MTNFIKSDDKPKKIEKEEDQNLSNFLPDFLINTVNIVSPPSNSRDKEENSQLIGNEFQDMNCINSYLQNLDVEDQSKQRELRPPQTKFYSASDVKDFKKKNFNKPPFKKQQTPLSQKQHVNNNYMNFPEQKYQFHTNQMSIFSFNTITNPFDSHNTNNCSTSNSNYASNNTNNNKPRAYSNPGFLKMPSSGSSGRSSLFRHDSEEKDEEDFESLQDLMSGVNMTIWEYAKKQKGSRNFQRLLDKIEPQDLNTLLLELKNHFTELMIDTYGNYFCQKLIQSCSCEQRLLILSDISHDFTFIACNSSGTHSIQTMIEIINMSSEEELIRQIIKTSILILSFNPNGTHVMQKILSTIKEDQRPDINEVIISSLPQFFNDSNGICVIKKFINGNKDFSLRSRLLNYIQSNCLEIIQSPFGNYVIQHILDKWEYDIVKDIIEAIIKNIASLSMQKFSSNVVEKCLDKANDNVRHRLIQELFNIGKISSLLKNKFGNFVLQKAIKLMEKDERKEIKENLTKGIEFSSNKEKIRLASLIEIL